MMFGNKMSSQSSRVIEGEDIRKIVRAGGRGEMNGELGEWGRWLQQNSAFWTQQGSHTIEFTMIVTVVTVVTACTGSA